MDSWFEVALVATIFAVGNILFGHFEERTPKWRRVAKVIVFLAVTRLIAVQFGRPWSYLVIAIPLALVLVIHGWWLPRQGINGWTGEPKERYYKFRGWTLPPMWDPIAGNYATRDGWIRLHTNAPHHRDAALGVLRVRADKAAVADAVRRWDAEALETAIVENKGCAAAMRSIDAWKQHPQGRIVATQPLFAPTHRSWARKISLTCCRRRRALCRSSASAPKAKISAAPARAIPTRWN